MHSYLCYFTNPAKHQRSHDTSRITDNLQHCGGVEAQITTPENAYRKLLVTARH